MTWKDGGAAYLPQISMVESQCGIPTDLLARIAYQECSWRAEVIDGTVKSPAGAVGMFQLMPQYFPGAGVSWMQDAETAGRYLSQLHRQFNDWQMAVAAYNWGPGNLSRYEQNPSGGLPRETKNYVAGVFTDVPVPGSLYGSLEA
jgi:soluble lytic murein transglycosylase-like protein